MSVSLLLIDPQNDFCSPGGALYIKDADKDLDRLSNFVKNNISKIDDVHVTLDCHPFFHIAHPCFWKDANGNDVPLYTTISYADFAEGKYTPSVLALRPRVEEYLIALENQGKYQLRIWPPHCILGTSGFSVYDALWQSLNDWERFRPGNMVDYVVKSKNPLTEHYSAIRAEVPDPSDVSTRTNFTLIDKLKQADTIYVAGEALSHCVANTLRDLFIYISPRKITLLRDCTSTLKPFEQQAEDFIQEFTAKGMNVIDSNSKII
ncbi:isochorismatase family protein [Treponema zioleckii]|uniref:isochorismatase family protein n=1 Tax=Treponema zioleckii TaxID=331680 RepID=UPI00168B93FB|nr:isochorismatase family protein [Treponema zioleckii]